MLLDKRKYHFDQNIRVAAFCPIIIGFQQEKNQEDKAFNGQLAQRQTSISQIWKIVWSDVRLATDLGFLENNIRLVSKGNGLVEL